MNKMPMVDILLSIYKPNMVWFEQLLVSLNKQTYKNLKLIIWNDCPDDFIDYNAIINKYIFNFEYKYVHASKNLGVIKAFEKLIELSSSDYIAFCDQDDIWLPDKIKLMISDILKTKSDLVCCDMFVIDGKNNMIADSIAKVRKKQKFYLGENLFFYLLLNNYVYGCATLIKTSCLKKVIPFPKGYYHDWWIALYISAYGKFSIINKPLIKYRIHGENQSGFLKGINNKEDYYNKWVLNYYNRMLSAKEIFKEERFQKIIMPFYLFAIKRKNYCLNHNLRTFKELFRIRKINKKAAYFELFLPLIPDYLFIYFIKLLRRLHI